jgi:hypothetical protein
MATTQPYRAACCVHAVLRLLQSAASHPRFFGTVASADGGRVVDAVAAAMLAMPRSEPLQLR